MESLVDVGVKLVQKRRKPMSKDPNPDWFWTEVDLIILVASLKAQNPKWGPKRLCTEVGVNEKKCKNILENYIYEEETCMLYRRSREVGESHRRCLMKEELIEKLRENHGLDHRKVDSLYESMRKSYFPIVRDTLTTLFKTEIKCEQCMCATELPKTTRARRPIPATYPNSRWQIDLKKMPMCRGFNYVLNIVDCYSRLGFGKALKGKTAKEVADALISFIYIYGAPRILQSDNGREFTNSDLEKMAKEFESIQMHGRPYHPQSQGRVERFNRTMTDYFRRTMVDDNNWVSSLEKFYYYYNNRVHKATRPQTPYQLFFRRPNFAAPLNDQVPYSSLSKDEREFLESAHLDVDEDNQEVTDLEDEVSSTEITDAHHAAVAVPVEEGYTPQATVLQEEPAKEDTLSTAVEIMAADASPLNEEQMWSPMSMPNLSPAVVLSSLSEQTDQSRDPISHENETESPMPSGPVFGPEVEPKDFEFSQSVSEYYRGMYKRRFSDPGRFADKENQEPPHKKASFVQRETLHRQMYPLEQFAENLQDEVIFYPNIGEAVYYRLNPALSAGTAFLQTGFYRQGLCIEIIKKPSGTTYKIKDSRTNMCHVVNRYQLKQSF